MQGRYLLGATPLQDTLAFLGRYTEVALHPAELEGRIASAAAARRRRPRPEDLQPPAPPPAAWSPHLRAVAARPLFQRLFGASRWQFAAVPVASLISVQPHVNWTFAERQGRGCPGEAEALAACLPVEPEPLEIWGGASTGESPSATFYTRDPNVRVTEVRLESAPRLTVSFTISKTAVFVQAVRLAGRLYLKNGVHRAVGLAAAGHEAIPCVLVDGEDLRDLPDLLPLHTLLRPDPPMVTDFLDPGQYIAHPWPDRAKFIRLVPEEFVSALPPGG